MRLTTTGVLVLALTVAATGARAEDAPKDPNQVICKVQKKTGTRFPDRTCHTRAEWAEMAEVNKRLMAEMRNRPVVETRPGN